MSCNSCAKGFSLLRKEKGCPSCGFSYCSKCLDYKIFVPKLNAEAKVCSKCKLSASQPAVAGNKIEPPDAYYRRLGMDDKVTSSNTPANDTDQQLLDRLKKLKEDRDLTPSHSTADGIRDRLQKLKGDIPSTSDTELHERLAKLKGCPAQTSTSKPLLLPPDTRTEQEQADDLIKQYLEQTTIDTKYNEEFDGLISEMESRMQKLKGSSADTAGVQPKAVDPESEDEELTVKKIVEKIKTEALLEDETFSPSTNDELPFCEICNEDATLRCLGCWYLFCKQCWREHKDDDDGCDKYEPYKAPKS